MMTDTDNIKIKEEIDSKSEIKRNEIILTALSHPNSSKLARSIALTASSASSIPLSLSGFNFKSTARSCCPMTSTIPYKKTSLPPSSATRQFSNAAAAAAAAAGQQNCKLEPKLNQSTFRQLLPIALFILSFATVLSILLIVYMDPTEIRHQQFRLNMSRDYELTSVAQDDPTLIEFLREIHMKKYPMHFLKNSLTEEHLNFTECHELTPDMARFIANLLGNKKCGNFIQSLTGSTRSHLTGPWLAETLNWTGTIVEPEPRQYFSLRQQNAHRSIEVVHACISPNRHPKEVTIYNEDDSEVKINSLMNDEMSLFSSRVKCFPLYTLMLAVNKIKYDLLSLGLQGHELEILQTLPFDKVNIEVISIHLPDQLDSITTLEPNSIHPSKFESASSLLSITSSISSSFAKTSDKIQAEKRYKTIKEYIQSITKFLMGKSYKFQKKFENNYIYSKVSSRTRKKYSQKRTP